MQRPGYLCLLLLACATVTARAQEGGPATLGSCSAIDDAATRLACYDRASGRLTPVPVPAPVPPPMSSPTTAPAAAPPPATAAGPGILARYWELEDDLKRGTFKFMTYKPNFLLPVHVTERLNRHPSSPTREAVSLEGYKRIEAKMQLSLRTKLAQSVLLPGADIWFGYTQQSMWQVWDNKGSAPFRNTDYEPELIYMVPTPASLQALPFGWSWRFGSVALAHQSNGQAKPLSRSWNRVYAAAGFERGEMTLTARALRRLPESGDDDDNPDLTDYRGRGEFQLSWLPGLATASATYRSTFKTLHRGALIVDVTYPVHSDEPTGLRWYLQFFSGYGETLTDYNFRQTSIGLGLAMFEF